MGIEKGVLTDERIGVLQNIARTDVFDEIDLGEISIVEIFLKARFPLDSIGAGSAKAIGPLPISIDLDLMHHHLGRRRIKIDGELRNVFDAALGEGLDDIVAKEGIFFPSFFGCRAGGSASSLEFLGVAQGPRGNHSSLPSLEWQEAELEAKGKIRF